MRRKGLILVAVDTVLVLLAVVFAYLLRFDFTIRQDLLPTIPYVVTGFAVFTILFLWMNKIYKRIWKYASVGDLISIIKGVFAGSGSFFLLHHFVYREIFFDINVPRSIFVLTPIITFLGIASARLFWRLLRDNYAKIQPHHRRALIIGAGDTGRMIVKELKQKDSDCYPVGFIDDNDVKVGMEVLGVPVLGKRVDIQVIARRHRIDDIILAMPSLSRLETAKIIEICKLTGCKIRMIPKVNDLINGKFSLNMIRNVSVEDLLGREPVNVDLAGISQYIVDKVVLVTGAGGSIGSELCRQVAMFQPRLILLLGHGENSIYDIELELRNSYPHLEINAIIADVQDKERIREVFETYRPNVVYHAAAHKHVPMMENNPLEAVKNNVLGTMNVVNCASDFQADRFVMISTDKAVNPTNVMGATKRVAEMIVQGKNKLNGTVFSAVRFGNVLGSRGSVIPLFKKQIEQGGPVTVTHPEMIRYFMTIPEAVQLVIQAGAIAKGGEIFILDMGKPVKISDLATDLIRLSGLEPGKDIEIRYTGIRPGEKLFEELLTNEEGTSGTKHDKIFVGKSELLQEHEFKMMVKSFEGLVAKGNEVTPEDVRGLLRKWVRTYKDSNDASLASEAARQEALRASLEVVASLERGSVGK